MSEAAARPFRWGLLGTGGVSRKFALGLRTLGGAAEVAVAASRSADNARRFTEEIGAGRPVADYAAAASAPEVDAIYVATPPSEHEVHALLAIAAGKPVLIEKPFALDADAARRIVRAAREADVFCMEAMWTRFLPLVEDIRDRISRGEIGAVRSMHGRFFGAVHPDPSVSLFDPGRGGGALMHRGVYALSLARHLLGPIVDVSSTARLGETGVDEDCTVTLRHASGALSSLEASLRTSGENAFSIHGEAGTIAVDAPIYRPYRAVICPVRPRRQDGGGGGRLETLREGGLAQGAQQRAHGLVRLLRGRRARTLLRPYRGNGYHYEAEAVMRAVAAGETESAVMPLDESVEVMAAIDAARAQWRAADA